MSEWQDWLYHDFYESADKYWVAYVQCHFFPICGSLSSMLRPSSSLIHPSVSAAFVSTDAMKLDRWEYCSRYMDSLNFEHQLHDTLNQATNTSCIRFLMLIIRPYGGTHRWWSASMCSWSMPSMSWSFDLDLLASRADLTSPRRSKNKLPWFCTYIHALFSLK